MTSANIRKSAFAPMLFRAGLIGATIGGAVLPVTQAQAIIVFDPSNYSQNILTAARTLTQINNQIRMLQNQAQSLINQARNLTTISFPELQAITQTIQQIDQLMGQAQVIQFRVGQATNQLLALVAKQQFQIENMMAAQYRAQAIDQARALQAQSDAHAAAAKFLGSGSAYTPQ